MSVLVGVLDQKIQGPRAVSWDTNKVGGLPTWLDSNSHQPVPECKNCGQASSLVTQIYCPLGGSPYHRCVYLFVCPGSCSRQLNGWSVFRSMKLDDSYQLNLNHATKSGCFDEIWDQDQDDWGDEWGQDQNDNCNGTDDSIKSVDELELTGDFSCKQTESDHFSTSVGDHVTGLGLHNDVSDVYINDSSPLLQSLESLSKLTLSNDEHHSDGRFSEYGDAEVSPVVESVGLADSERWDAMANLLNTKLVQDLQPDPVLLSKSNAVFEPYFLSVLEEPHDEVVECDHLNDLIRSYERSEGKQLHLLMSESLKTTKDKDMPAEIYERTEVKHGDKMFHKFLKRLHRCPQQCIRYERGGNPLLIDHLSREPVSKCPNCQGKRIFEFQLLPQLIPSLKTQDGTPCKVEFGTVLVFTCEQNCWPANLDPACKLNLLEEGIVLQGDPDVHLYR